MSIFGVFLTLMTIYLSVMYKRQYPTRIIGLYILYATILLQIICHIIAWVAQSDATRKIVWFITG